MLLWKKESVNMEIREYYGKEVIKLKKICMPMFRSGNPDMADEEKYAQLLEQEDAAKGIDFVRWGAFDGDRLCASIQSEAFLVNLDDQQVKMSGIGAVVSDFNPPRKGLMKDLFLKGFERMRETEQILSHLYPFQANYYRQYGYEISCKHFLWKLPVEYISRNGSGKYVYYDGSDKMKQEIMDIYCSFAKKYNLSIVKSVENWEKFFKTILPYAGKYFSYLHYDGEKADAFMRYKVVTNVERPQDLFVDSLWFTDYRALRGILSYFVSQRPYADRVLIKTPVNVDLSACNEFQGGWGKRDTICEMVFDGTTRVVDVQKVLRAVRYRGSGKVCIRIEGDIYCPWNNGCFTVSFGSETTVVRGGTPDIVMNINAFTAMILGAVSLEDGLIFPQVEIYGKNEELEKVFYKKNHYIDVHF